MKWLKNLFVSTERQAARTAYAAFIAEVRRENKRHKEDNASAPRHEVP